MESITGGAGMNHIEMMRLAESITRTSTCPERQVGASVLFENGKWTSIANDCAYDSTNNHHAEARLIRWVFALHGDHDQFKGATLYTTCRPCVRCTNMLLGLGLKAVYYRDAQPEMNHLMFLEQEGVAVDSRWIKEQMRAQTLERVQGTWAERCQWSACDACPQKGESVCCGGVR
jgi:deoxycytidylate deaminase